MYLFAATFQGAMQPAVKHGVWARVGSASLGEGMRGGTKVHAQPGAQQGQRASQKRVCEHAWIILYLGCAARTKVGADGVDRIILKRLVLLDDQVVRVALESLNE